MYLKTNRDHYKEGDSCCPDDGRVFALRDVIDAAYQELCSHNHDITCSDCESLKSVLQEKECL